MLAESVKSANKVFLNNNKKVEGKRIMDNEGVSSLTKDRPWVRQHKVRTAFAGAKWRSLFLLTSAFYKQM